MPEGARGKELLELLMLEAEPDRRVIDLFQRMVRTQGVQHRSRVWGLCNLTIRRQSGSYRLNDAAGVLLRGLYFAVRCHLRGEFPQHRGNIGRLTRGEEPKFSFSKKQDEA